MRSKTAILFALPLAMILAGCSLLGGTNVSTQPQTSRLLYISQTTTNAVLAVDIESRSSHGSPITGYFNGPGNMVAVGDYLYVVNQNGNSVTEINRKTQQMNRTFNTGRNPWGIAVSPDGLYLYVTNTGDGTVSRIRLANGASEVISVTSGTNANLYPMGICILKSTSSNSYYAFVANERPDSNTSTVNGVTTTTSNGVVTIIKDSTKLNEIKITGAVQMRNVALANNNAILYVTDQSKTAIYAINVQNPEAAVNLTDVNPESGSVSDILAGPTGTGAAGYIFASYRDSKQRSDGVLSGGLTIRTASNGSKVADPSLSGGLSPSSMAISSDGTSLFVGTSSNVLWMDITNPATPREPIILRISDQQEYQGASPTDIVLAGGVPNQR
ncbi:MAG TPA: hypothetical protein DD435_00760 [Cyanobacteria bacterium UBA8530]|nr:hypothetical protein [Cyanobacteria bacterium UBA8530]